MKSVTLSNLSEKEIQLVLAAREAKEAGEVQRNIKLSAFAAIAKWAKHTEPEDIKLTWSEYVNSGAFDELSTLNSYNDNVNKIMFGLLTKLCQALDSDFVDEAKAIAAGNVEKAWRDASKSQPEIDKPSWTSVEQRMPEPDTTLDVIYLNDHNEQKRMLDIIYDGDGDWIYRNGNIFEGRVTHWMTVLMPS